MVTCYLGQIHELAHLGQQPSWPALPLSFSFVHCVHVPDYKSLTRGPLESVTNASSSGSYDRRQVDPRTGASPPLRIETNSRPYSPRGCCGQFLADIPSSLGHIN